MRGIKFRGKKKDGQWMYGNLIDCTCFRSILDIVAASKCPIDILGAEIIRGKVDDSTIGQYVGQKDSDGKEIYEGDILRTKDRFELVMVVTWNEKFSQFGFVTRELWKERSYSFAWRFFSDIPSSKMEIIGNIYDNPNILEER